MAQHILVVDDEQIIRESLSFILKKEGYDVEEAANGKDALAKHSANPFDIIITDIEMPEMKGVDLLKQIRQRTPQTLVVIITAFGSVETAVLALREGAALPRRADQRHHRRPLPRSSELRQPARGRGRAGRADLHPSAPAAACGA